MRDRFAQFWRMIQKQKSLETIAQIKTKLYNQGYANQLSFYGICRIKTPEGEQYRRIEIFSKQELTPYEVQVIHALFTHYIFPKTDTLCIYENGKIKEMIKIEQ